MGKVSNNKLMIGSVEIFLIGCVCSIFASAMIINFDLKKTEKKYDGISSKGNSDTQNMFQSTMIKSKQEQVI